MLFIALLAYGFTVVDQDSLPIAGAWVGTVNEWVAFTDPDGFLPHGLIDADTLRIHATGFSDWRGPVPDPESVVVLQATSFGAETITVPGSRGSLGGIAPASVTLDRGSLQDLSLMGMERLASRVPGVTVREYGGAMPVTSISLRGADPSQIDYMVNGVSVVSARDGMPTGIFDPSIFTGLEVAGGGGLPGGEGTGNGGALNYLPPAGEPLSLTLSALSDGGVSMAGLMGRTGFSARRNIGPEGTEGYSLSSVTTLSRENLTGGLLAGWASGDTEAPEWSVQGDGKRTNGQISGWLNLSTERFEADLSGGSGFMDYTQSLPYIMDDTHSDHSARFSAAWKGPVLVKAGTALTVVNSTASGDHSAESFFLETLYSGGQATAFAGCRINRGEAHLSARLNFTGIPPFAGIRATGSVFTDHRTPTINDLYWPFDGTTTGNPELRSERSTGAEAGFEWSGELLHAGATAFITSTDDLIIWLPDQSGIWTPSNISSSLSRGVEFTAGSNFMNGSLQGHFTWNIAEDRTEDTPRYGMLIPYRPEYTWDLSLSVPVTRRSISAETSISGTGKRFINRTQTEYLGEYTLTDASLAVRPCRSFTITISVANLFNTDYSTGNGYRGKGRNFGLSLQYRSE